MYVLNKGKIMKMEWITLVAFQEWRGMQLIKERNYESGRGTWFCAAYE